MIGTTYWAWLGTIYIIILTVRDYKNNMNVDDRPNWFMMGITISLYSHFNYGLLYIFGLLALVFLLRWFLGKFKALGEADLNSIIWMIMGFTILKGIPGIFFFYVGLIVLTILYSGIKKLFKMDHIATPFYSVLLIIYIGTCLNFGLYL